MPLPNFLILGAPKCGTTSLQSYLGQHQDVCFSKYKEPNFFAFDGQILPEKGPVSPELMDELIYFHSINNISDYEKQFSHHNGEPIIGDASVRHLYTAVAAGRIKERVPNAKMVAVLREPVSRLYSHYCMNVQYQIEPLPLMDAIEAEQSRIKDDWGWDWHYTSIGRYTQQIQRFYSLFDKEQIKIFLFDDFKSNPQRVVSEICQFLEIEDFTPDMSKKGKVAYWPQNLAFDRWINRDNFTRRLLERPMSFRVKTKMNSILKHINRREVPRINPADRDQLQQLFTLEAEELSDLLGRQIPWYKK